MFEFKIKSPVGKFSKKHLERYQVRDPSQRHCDGSIDVGDRIYILVTSARRPH